MRFEPVSRCQWVQPDSLPNVQTGQAFLFDHRIQRLAAESKQISDVVDRESLSVGADDF